MDPTLPKSCNDERGRAAPAILLALAGAVIGAPLGFLAGGVVAQVMCGTGDGSFGAGESCGMAYLLFSFFGIPIGAVAGAIVGAFVGARRSRGSRTEDGSRSDEPPAVEREAPVSAWLAVAGGVAIAFGAFAGWRTVSVPYAQVSLLDGALTPGPEPIAFVGGLLVLLGGILRVLRPAAPAPAALIGVGMGLALAGVAWGLVDLLQVPADLTRHLFVGYWISAVGGALAVVGLLTDRPARDRWRARRPVQP
jgi:hypothetical protein